MTKIPLGFTHTEIETTAEIDTVDALVEYLCAFGGRCDGFLAGPHLFEVVCETLTDGSEKRSIRVRPID